MAHASVTHTDIWSSANNQAGLAWLENFAAAMYYENRLNVKSLSVQAGSLAMPVKATIIGLNYRYFGYAKYNETKIGLAIARKLGEKFALGVQMDYFHTHFSYDYGNFNMLSAEIGLLCKPMDNLTIGAHIFNISRSRQKANPTEYIPTIMRLGLEYSIHEKAIISIETEKDTRMKAIFKAGLEVIPIKSLFLRCGISSGPMYQYAFGIGYKWKLLSLDMAFTHHQVLGYSPHVSISVNL
jgi:hypothetical protein